jgi:hypothetical protein
MPPPFTCGCHLVASGCWSAKDESGVVVPPEAVIPDTAEWCYPAQALKCARDVLMRRVCPWLCRPLVGAALQGRTSIPIYRPPAPEPLAH